LFEFYVR